MFLPWTPSLSNPFSWMLLFYLSFHCSPDRLSLSPPQVRFPRLYLAPGPSFLSQDCVSPTSHLPHRNLSRTILEWSWHSDKKESNWKENFTHQETGKYLTNICGKVFAKSSASSDVELSAIWFPLRWRWARSTFLGWMIEQMWGIIDLSNLALNKIQDFFPLYSCSFFLSESPIAGIQRAKFCPQLWVMTPTKARSSYVCIQRKYWALGTQIQQQRSSHLFAYILKPL